MLKITEIKIRDRNSHDPASQPDYECDIVVKYYDGDKPRANQIEVKSLAFSKEFLNEIAEQLLRQFTDKMTQPLPVDKA